jgi:nitrite reductase/ring-hydroxylating ferredoxin subunit
MTHGTIAGIILSTVTAPNGGEHEWLQLYAPTRFKVQASGELLQENADVAKEMAKGYLGPAEVSSTDEVKPGCGALMRNGVSKAAVYRDNDGRVHTFSAVCPHKGGEVDDCTVALSSFDRMIAPGIVQFNSGEQSFDCPLHGSRFDAVTGRAICGPTMLDLEDIAEKLNIE